MKHYLCLTATLAIAAVLCSCNNPSPEAVEPLEVSNTTALDRNHRVIYELNLYNFTQEGTLKAAKARLEELRSLGVDIVWLMPIQPRSKRGKIGSLGSPYALQDYTKVNPQHGTLDDLKAYTEEAHRLGMEVWMDWVPNHTGLDHVWVTEHKDYYQQKDGEIVHPNNYGDVYQLDYSNNELRQAMTDAVIYWVENAGIDGFRFDYISSPAIPAEFWQEAIPAIRKAGKDKYIGMLAEGDLADRKDLYSVGFDYDYAWGFHDNIAQKVGTTDKAKVLQNWCNSLVSNSNYDNMDRMVYLTNHDDGNDGKNYFSDFGNNVPPLTVMEFTLYGMPMLYNGQEIGYRPVQDYFNKSLINWSSPDKKLQNTIATLIALRHTQPALSSGKKAERGTTTFLDTDQKTTVLCYKREKDDNQVVVAVNLSTDSATFTIQGVDEGNYAQWLNSATVQNGTTLTPRHLTANPTLTLGGKGYAVYVKE